MQQRKGDERVDYGLGRSLRQVWGVMQEMSRMLEVAHGLDAHAGSRSRPGEWEPVVSEMPSGNELLLYFELPGVEREDVDLALQGRKLIVSGVKKEIEVPEAEELINGFSARRAAGLGSMSYRPFKRVVELPQHTEEEDIQAVFGVGILQIRVVNVAGQRSRRIHIRSGKYPRS